MTDRQNITLGNNYSWALQNFRVRWPLRLMINASFLAEINFLHQHPWTSICECVQWRRATPALPFDECPRRYRRCRQQCGRCCWFNHRLSLCVRTAGSFVFRADHRASRAVRTQKEGYSWSICQRAMTGSSLRNVRAVRPRLCMWDVCLYKSVRRW